MFTLLGGERLFSGEYRKACGRIRHRTSPWEGDCCRIEDKRFEPVAASRQNCASARLSKWHCGHFIFGLLDATPDMQISGESLLPEVMDQKCKKSALYYPFLTLGRKMSNNSNIITISTVLFQSALPFCSWAL